MPRVRCVDLGTMTLCNFLECRFEEGPCVTTLVGRALGWGGGECIVLCTPEISGAVKICKGSNVWHLLQGDEGLIVL